MSTIPYSQFVRSADAEGSLTVRDEDAIRHYRNRKQDSFGDDGIEPLHIPYEVFKKLPYFTMEQLGIRDPFDQIGHITERARL